MKQDKLGEQLLSTRFLANIHIVGIPYPSPSSLQTVYQHMLIPVFSSISQYLLIFSFLTPAMIDLFTHTHTHIHTSQAHTHYMFTPHDLTNWVIISFHIITHRMMLIICKCYIPGHTRHCISSEADWTTRSALLSHRPHRSHTPSLSIFHSLP